MRWPWSNKTPPGSLLNGDTPVPARLYTRDGCGLCHDLLQMLADLGLHDRLRVEEVDVDGDRELKKRYGLRLPVLEIDGALVFEGRPEAVGLRRAVTEALTRS
jgi:predicted thioredoxin/glutaredoxin